MAHYGAAHTGVCLRFDRGELLRSFAAEPVADARRFHGPVKYLTAALGSGPYGIDIGQVKEFGVDAVATAYAETNKESIFFRKHSDWSNEAEYRLVVMDQSIFPYHFDIHGAMTAVFLGDAFPQGRLPALLAVLEEYPNTDIFQLRFHNRYLGCFPFERSATAIDGSRVRSLWATPNRSGSLSQRLAALRDAEGTASRQRDRAEALCSEHMAVVQDGMGVIGGELQSWPSTQVAVYPRIAAVPEPQRSRQPGVPGERVHLERGYMCVVENLPIYSYTFVAAAAIQMLDNDQLRVHAVVTTERWAAEGNAREERWRSTREVALTDGPCAIASLMSELKEAVQTARLGFDRDRGQEQPPPESG